MQCGSNSPLKRGDQEGCFKNVSLCRDAFPVNKFVEIPLSLPFERGGHLLLLFRVDVVQNGIAPDMGRAKWRL